MRSVFQFAASPPCGSRNSTCSSSPYCVTISNYIPLMNIEYVLMVYQRSRQCVSFHTLKVSITNVTIFYTHFWCNCLSRQIKVLFLVVTHTYFCINIKRTGATCIYKMALCFFLFKNNTSSHVLVLVQLFYRLICHLLHWYAIYVIFSIGMQYMSSSPLVCNICHLLHWYAIYVIFSIGMQYLLELQPPYNDL